MIRPPLFASAKGGRVKRSETQGVHTPNTTPYIPSILEILQIRVQTTTSFPRTREPRKSKARHFPSPSMGEG